MATLGGQRIPFKSVRRLGYYHPEPMVILFCHPSASLKLRRLSGFLEDFQLSETTHQPPI